MSKARNIADLLDATGDVVSSALDNVPPSDNASSLTTGTLPVARLADGSITSAKLDNNAKVVKSASAPSSPSEGDLWYDQTNEVLKIYQSSVSNFVKVSAEIAILSSVSGSLFVNQSSNLTLSGSGFLSSTLIVNFLQSSDGINENVTVTASSDTTATVAVPSAVYNNVTNGNVVTIKVTNADGKVSGNQTITSEVPPYNADFLVIAGGGGGGYDRGGGGGAGGYRNSYNSETSGRNSSSENSLVFNAGTTYTILIGGGGAGGNTSTVRGSIGSNSSISGSDITDIISSGGGGGGTGAGGVRDGLDGGSGGGEAYAGTGSQNGSGTANQGFDGGNYIVGSGTNSGGGGGASQNGDTGSPYSGGNGLASSITGSSVTRGGGGGGHNGSASSPSGGNGGGGNGGRDGSNLPTSGSANTGGGGGAGVGTEGGSATNRDGGSGGSGVVILRMPTANYSGTTTGSPTVSISGTDTILTFTGSGTYTG